MRHIIKCSLFTREWTLSDCGIFRVLSVTIKNKGSITNIWRTAVYQFCVIQIGATKTTSALSKRTFCTSLPVKPKGGKAYIKFSDHLIANASIAMASGSGFHDINFCICLFNLDANISISGEPNSWAIALNISLFNTHSVLSSNIVEGKSASFINPGM